MDLDLVSNQGRVSRCGLCSLQSLLGLGPLIVLSLLYQRSPCKTWFCLRKKEAIVWFKVSVFTMGRKDICAPPSKNFRFLYCFFKSIYVSCQSMDHLFHSITSVKQHIPSIEWLSNQINLLDIFFALPLWPSWVNFSFGWASSTIPGFCRCLF